MRPAAPAETRVSLEPEEPLGAKGHGAEGSFFDLSFIRRAMGATIAQSLVSRWSMYPGIPPELTHSALQLVVSFVSVVGAVFGLLLGARA